jgi:hypothetical protein
MIEDGHWRQGKRDGRDWLDVKTGGGLAYGSAVSTGYNDCVACRDNYNNDRHTAIATIRKDPAYVPPGNPEVELIVGCNISSGSIRLYEFLWAHAGTWQIVRWNGAIGDFNFGLPAIGSGPGVPKDGDIMELRYDATNPAEVVLRCYKNGQLVATARDSTPGRITSGNPGLSFYALSGTNADMSRYCFTSWACSPTV